MSQECDHEWKLIDDSFDHEFGTETILYERCERCDEEREYEPDCFSWEDC